MFLVCVDDKDLLEIHNKKLADRGGKVKTAQGILFLLLPFVLNKAIRHKTSSSFLPFFPDDIYKMPFSPSSFDFFLAF